jgi:RNA polymerase-binding transcription factor DksA
MVPVASCSQHDEQDIREAAMTSQERQHYARRLDEERSRLTGILRELETEAELDVIEATPDRAAREGLSDAEAAEAASAMELDQLRAVDAAIVRLRDYPLEYGLCAVCHQPIGTERLELLPWTNRCAKHVASLTPEDAASPSHAGPTLE